ncbi:MAG: hypothetical protein IKG03_05140 [Clostridiales bacterium]|nr:hypothetical protein [Clostridiales bacterium]
MREEKKYEVLPGVEIPDMKKIQEAASDFSVSEIGEVDIKTVTFQPVVQAQPQGASSADLSQLQQLGDKVAADEARSKAESREKMDKIMHNVKAPESIRDLKESHIAHVNAEKRKELEESLKAEEQHQAEEDAKNKAREERRQLQQRLLEESRERAAKLKAEKERLDKALAAKEEKERAEKEKAENEAAEKEAAGKEAGENEAAASVSAEEKPAVAEPAKQNEDKPSEKSEPAAEQKAPEEEKTEAPAPKPVQPEVKKTAKVVSDAKAFDDFKEFLEDDQ